MTLENNTIAESVRHELDDHLQSINENTSEIQALFEYLQEIELKIDRLAQRVEHFELLESRPLPTIVSLTIMEKKVFVILYTEDLPLSYPEIAEKAGLPAALVPECISSLVSKGIPLIRSYYKEQLYLRLAPRFKEMQARENRVNLSLQSFIE